MHGGAKQRLLAGGDAGRQLPGHLTAQCGGSEGSGHGPRGRENETLGVPAAGRRLASPAADLCRGLCTVAFLVQPGPLAIVIPISEVKRLRF